MCFKKFIFNIFGGFQENEYFWGYEDFVHIFGVITKFDLVISMYFRVFFEDIFGGKQ